MAMGEIGVPMQFGNKEPLVVGNKVFTSSSVFELTEEELQKARIELGETEEKKKKGLEELKSRLSKEGNYRLDDAFLLRFLRVRKYDAEKAYQNVKNYYNNRKKHPTLYDIHSNLNLLENFDFLTCLPYADEQGRLVFWSDMGCWNPQETSFTQKLPLVIGLNETVAMNPKCQVNGIIGIWDMKELSARKVAEVLKKNQLFALLSVLVFSIPWRVEKLILLNTSRVVRFLCNLCRPIVTKKISERTFLLGSDLSELHQHVNPAILPKKLGGQLENAACIDPMFLPNNLSYLEYDRSFTGD